MCEPSPSYIRVGTTKVPCAGPEQRRLEVRRALRAAVAAASVAKMDTTEPGVETEFDLAIEAMESLYRAIPPKKDGAP